MFPHNVSPNFPKKITKIHLPYLWHFATLSNRRKLQKDTESILWVNHCVSGNVLISTQSRMFNQRQNVDETCRHIPRHCCNFWPYYSWPHDVTWPENGECGWVSWVQRVYCSCPDSKPWLWFFSGQPVSGFKKYLYNRATNKLLLIDPLNVKLKLFGHDMLFSCNDQESRRWQCLLKWT